jgi:hypothetical protein
MKTKLLKRLRAIGRCMINIHSVTTCGGTVTGMKYGYDHNEYAKMFNYGDTEKDMKNKAERIYISFNIEQIRKRYAKYSRKYRG